MKYFLLPLLLSAFSFSLLAQPAPCEGEPAMTSFCVDACVICDIDGFTGRNTSMGQGQDLANGPFCTTFTHNMNFIAFIAGTENLTLEVDVSNCQSIWGLEIGIFESFDCETFIPVVDCNTDVAPNTTATFSNTTPLVIGQHYYLMMDGSAGDVCDWTFRVTDGSTAVDPLTTSGMVEAAADLTCPDNDVLFTTTGTEPGAALFRWSVDNVDVTTTTQPAANLRFPAAGSYEVCVVASNVCDEAPPSCRMIAVRDIGTLSLNQQICDGDTLFVADTALTTAGTFNFALPALPGCDSLIDVTIEVLPQASQFIDINLCVGEEFFIGPTPYSSTGVFLDTILTADQCDSIVTLDLFMIECEIIGSTGFVAPVCQGEATGQLIFSVENGTPPFSFDYENILEPVISGAGTTNLLENNVIDGVPVGEYEINVRDNFGNDVVLFQTVTEPAALSVTALAAEIGAFNLSCFDGADGRVSASGAGGVLPYTFAWSNNQVGAVVGGLPAGTYTVSITDAAGCVRTDAVELVPPPAIDYAVAFNDPTCEGFETGVIALTGASGGTPPFRFSLGSAAPDTVAAYGDLPEGTYIAVVTDANDCRVDTTATIIAPEIPVIFPWEPVSTALGCAALIPTQINDVAVADIRWDGPPNTLDCDTCLRPRALPFTTAEYVLTVTSAGGCSTTDSLTVEVIPNRDVYTPTAFSPNGDGVNDRFLINPGKSTREIAIMRVYGRWGELLFEETNSLPNDAAAGWDGRRDNEPLPPGVYVWTARVIFLDGEVAELSGEVLLVR